MAENLPQANFGGPGGRLDFNRDRRRLLVVGFFFFGLFLLALGGGLFFFKSSSGSDDIQIISSNSDTVSETEVVVHVDGAVVAPGVFRLSSDLRVTDAISAAGGLTGEADRSRINLAAKISDGQKIYIPASGEVTSDKGQVISGTTSLVNINTTTESELDKLPGVGPVTAQKIIASRPYSALEDLLSKKVVSRSTYEKIKDLITF